MRFPCWLVLGLTCIAGSARGETPPIDGHVALGVRTSSTTEPHYDFVVDDTASVRGAVDGLVGFRFGRTVVGVHAGIATPLRFYASHLFDSGEQVASTTSSIYPLDIGLGVQLDAGARFWLSAWLGATVAFAHASSPAEQISAIDFTGNIAASSWTDHSIGLGFGAELGYDLVEHERGRLAVLVTVASQDIGPIPLRDNDGQHSSEPEDVTCRSLTVGVAYGF